MSQWRDPPPPKTLMRSARHMPVTEEPEEGADAQRPNLNSAGLLDLERRTFQGARRTISEGAAPLASSDDASEDAASRRISSAEALGLRRNYSADTSGALGLTRQGSLVLARQGSDLLKDALGQVEAAAQKPPLPPPSAVRARMSRRAETAPSLDAASRASPPPLPAKSASPSGLSARFLLGGGGGSSPTKRASRRGGSDGGEARARASRGMDLLKNSMSEVDGAFATAGGDGNEGSFEFVNPLHAALDARAGEQEDEAVSISKLSPRKSILASAVSAISAVVGGSGGRPDHRRSVSDSAAAASSARRSSMDVHMVEEQRRLAGLKGASQF
jgi:hypothetical protein